MNKSISNNIYITPRVYINKFTIRRMINCIFNTHLQLLGGLFIYEKIQ